MIRARPRPTSTRYSYSSLSVLYTRISLHFYAIHFVVFITHCSKSLCYAGCLYAVRVELLFTLRLHYVCCRRLSFSSISIRRVSPSRFVMVTFSGSGDSKQVANAYKDKSKPAEIRKSNITAAKGLLKKKLSLKWLYSVTIYLPLFNVSLRPSTNF